MPRSLDAQIKSTYLFLRVTLAFAAFSLPLLLFFGGHLVAHIPIRDSMSAYYWAAPGQICQCSCDIPASGKCPAIDESNWTDKQRSEWTDHLKAGTMRNYFVGFLFAVGAILFVYKGYTWKEDWALNFSGAMAVSIALNPTPWDCAKHQVTLHGASAILFFLGIAYVCVFRSTDTLLLIHEPRTQAHFKLWYRALGVIMIGSPLFALIYTELRHRNDHYIFSAEMAGIYAFSIFWVVKIREIGIISKQRHFEKSIESVLPA